MASDVQFKKYVFLSLGFLLPSLKSLFDSWGYINNTRGAEYYSENAKYSVDIQYTIQSICKYKKKEKDLAF